MKYVSFVIVILLYSHLCLSQINSGPSPTIGWDSLKTLLKYPELARRAGLEGKAIVTVIVNSKGDFMGLNVSSESQIFADLIKHVLPDIKWNPAMKNGQAVQSTMTFPVNFILNEQYEGPCLIIKGQWKQQH